MLSEFSLHLWLMCQRSTKLEIPFRALHSQRSQILLLASAALSTRSHVTSQCRCQARNPPRVRSTIAHSQLLRARPSSFGERRQQNSQPLAPTVEWQCCFTAGAAAIGQTAQAQQQTSAATRTQTHPRRQPQASPGQLHSAAAVRAGGDRHSAVPSHSASLRQGGAASQEQSNEEENSSRE